MQNYYQFIIPRLNGETLKRDFKYYLSLVEKGVAGFIIFGGDLNQVRAYIKRLQEKAGLPLIIASDLERGVGQQLRGGTLFPPAMALANAVKGRDSNLLGKAFRAIAEEARYAGINAVFAPVLDINTNPKNPIISTRAFGEDAETVSICGSKMIRTLQRHGVAACGKHFPGHGDTAVDSHIGLPVIDRSLKTLRRNELLPFTKAIKEGVKMLMLGHLNVPAIDPSGIPVSISKKAVGYLRKNMKYKGILITDAMNMGGLGKFPEETASFMALKAGVDLILHPTDPEKTALYLGQRNIVFNEDRLRHFRRGLPGLPAESPPRFDGHAKLSDQLTEKALNISGEFKVSGTPFIIILDDDAPSPTPLSRGDGVKRRVKNFSKSEKGGALIERLNTYFPNLRFYVMNYNSDISKTAIPDKAFIIVAVFSETRGWKGGAGRWLYKKTACLEDKADLFISFGSPYLLDNIRGPAKILAYWDSDAAQRAVAEVISGK